MWKLHPSFAAPSYLWLLVLLPVLIWYSWRRVAGLGRIRGLCVLLMRTLVVLLLILAAAEIQLVRTTDQLTVLFLVDQSLSIPPAKRVATLEYVKKEVARHRRNKDRAGLIVFGRDATIEIPPIDDKLPVGKTIESLVDPEYTNIAEAMKLAQATFPEDAARRVVLISDGNQNEGNAAEQAQAMAEAGIGIDVVPIRYYARREVAVERVMMPAEVRRELSFELRVVVENFCKPEGKFNGEVPGRLVVSQIADDQPHVVSDEEVVLPPGKKVFTVRQKIDSANFYTYEAKFIPKNPADDTMPQNNRATAFTHVVGRGQVLLVEDVEHRGQHDYLVSRLRKQGLEVTVRGSDQLFTSLAELQQYDTVVLANVPRSTNDEVSFSDEQIDILVRNTQQMGSGLVMLGGPNSFGAGGWTGTELEKAMPVDFQVRDAKVSARGALVLVMHATEIADGNHIQKLIAKESIKTLSGQDYCGVMQWDGNEVWITGGGPMNIGRFRNRLLAAVDRMVPGDMPDFEPAMQLADQGFRQLTDASVKHMVVISDGDPSKANPNTIASLRAGGVTISTVAVGAHGPAESQTLSDMAADGGGKYYAVNNANALPRIFQREARRVSRPLVYEQADGIKLALSKLSAQEILSGIDSLPPIEGYVLTSKKENSIVETAVRGLRPAGEENSTVLAGWTYGAGRAVAFTSDAGERWTKAWTSLPVYDKLFGQMIRWSMRPSGTTGKFTTTFEPREGQMRVVITALNAEDDFLNFLTMTAAAVGPDLKKPLTFDVEQVGPGRYVGNFPARDAGSYFVSISPGRGMSPIRAGVSVPYSDEFRDRGSNDLLLKQLAATVPKGGIAGLLIENEKQPNDVESLLAFDTFRHDLAPAKSSQDMWHWFLLAACVVYFFDILLRRLDVYMVVAWAVRICGAVFVRKPLPAAPAYIERLRSRKAEVAGQLEQMRAATRFETPPASQQGPPLGAEPLPQVDKPSAAPPSIAAEPKAEEESYTERLLKAKKKAFDDRQS